MGQTTGRASSVQPRITRVNCLQLSCSHAAMQQGQWLPMKCTTPCYSMLQGLAVILP